MPTYSTEFKDNIVRKMMPPNSQSVEQICKEVGISRSTRNWKPIKEVWLNPRKEQINESINLKQAA
jgi:hypothetical protein